MPSLPLFRLLRLAVPVALTTSRLLLGPVLLLLVLMQVPRSVYPVVIVVGFLTDWVDGIAARWLGVAEPWLRRYDIVADLVFYLGTLVAAVWLEPDLLGRYTVPIVGLLVLEVVCQVVHAVRFSVMIATHAYLCKIWSVSLALVMTILLGWGAVAEPWVIVCLVLGYLAYLDVLLILAIADRVPVDVVSSYHVWRDRGNSEVGGRG